MFAFERTQEGFALLGILSTERVRNLLSPCGARGRASPEVGVVAIDGLLTRPCMCIALSGKG